MSPTSNAECLRLYQETMRVLLVLGTNLYQRHDNGDSLESCEEHIRNMSQTIMETQAKCALAVKHHPVSLLRFALPSNNTEDGRE